jgi:hypothetical protein
MKTGSIFHSVRLDCQRFSRILPLWGLCVRPQSPPPKAKPLDSPSLALFASPPVHSAATAQRSIANPCPDNSSYEPMPALSLKRGVSKTVSQNNGGVVENCGGYRRIVLDFTGVFAILLVSESLLQIVFICG